MSPARELVPQSCWGQARDHHDKSPIEVAALLYMMITGIGIGSPDGEYGIRTQAFTGKGTGKATFSRDAANVP